jgi:predicted Zn-dependent peptidase
MHIPRSRTRIFLSLAAVLAGVCGSLTAQNAMQVPVEYHKLSNGLKVVLSPDRTAPVVTVAVYYNIGFRLEPRNRTGFAHLFEHMMFQGSSNLGKMEFIRLINSNGGQLNGSTRFDFTNYFEILPSHKLETALWAEADRMRGLEITQENLVNQQGVVKNEVKVNVLNQPYGGFPWLDLPQVANTNWFNAHNFYGDLSHLDAATLEDVKSFFTTYYSPNNAVVVVVGDFVPADALRMIRTHFENIPASQLPPPPDLSEPRQEQERRQVKVDSLANRPALAFGYHMPDRNTPEYWAMGIIDQILLRGTDSRLHQAVVQQRGLTDRVIGGINVGLGNMYNYNGPMLWTGYLFHDASKTPASILAAVDSVIEDLQARPVDRATLDRARVKLRSNLYDVLGGLGFGRADLLACFALFDDDPSRINRIEAEFARVTPELIQKTAREYLRSGNRTILTIDAKAPAQGASR